MRSQLKQCKAGYAVLLTNDSSYWKIPDGRDTVDPEFRIHDGPEVSGVLAWTPSAEPGTVKGRESPIEIHDSYHLRWQEYSNFPGKKYGSSRYLAVSVESFRATTALLSVP